MSLDCIIYVGGKADGFSGHGRPNEGMREPVHRFLRDSQHYYNAVLRHLRECEKCDPKEALYGYLVNRLSKPKNFGRMSQTLMRMAAQYREKFGERVPGPMVNEFLWRGMSSWDEFLLHVESFSQEEIDLAYAAAIESWKSELRYYLRKFEHAVKRGGGSQFSHLAQRGPFWFVEPRRSGDGPNIARLLGMVADARLTDERELAGHDPEVLRFMDLVKVHEVLTL